MDVGDASELKALARIRKYGEIRADFELDDSERSKRPKTTFIEFEMEALSERCGRFSEDYVIDVGSCGVVYYIKLNDDDAVVARYLHDRVSPLSLNDFCKQVTSIARLDHENVIKLRGFSSSASTEDSERAIVYEFAKHLSLYDSLHGTFVEAVCLSWDQRLDIMIDAARGLAYLHQQHITYEDFRSKNVLLFEGLKAKISDINVRYRDPDLKTIWPDCLQHTYHDGYVTYDFFIRGCDVSQNTDIYSFGVVLMEILTGMKYFDKTLTERTIFDRALPFLGKQKLANILDPKLGHHPQKAAFMVAALAAYCILPPPTLRPNMDFVLDMLELIREDPDDVKIQERKKVAEARLGPQDLTSGVAAEIKLLLEQEMNFEFFNVIDWLFPKLREMSLDPAIEMLKAEIWLLTMF